MFRLLFLYAAGLVLLIGSTNVLALPVDKGSGSSVRPQAAGHGHAGASNAAGLHVESPAELQAKAKRLNDVASKGHAELRDIFNWIGDEKSIEREKGIKRAKKHDKASKWHAKESENRHAMAENPNIASTKGMSANRSIMNAVDSNNDAKAALANYEAYQAKGIVGDSNRAAHYYKEFDHHAKLSVTHIPGTKSYKDPDPIGHFKTMTESYDKAKDSVDRMKKKKEEGPQSPYELQG